MHENFWTHARVTELEHDLLEAQDHDEAAEWLWNRLKNVPSEGKTDFLSVLDTVSDLTTEVWHDMTIEKHGRLIGFLHHWRQQHGG